MTNTMLETKGLTMRFGGVTAVNNFNLRIDKGEIVGIIGPNGAGKTTAFNMITGVYLPTEGDVLYTEASGNVISLVGKRPDQITAMGFARTFQNIRLFSGLSVFDNIMVANHVHVKSSIVGAITRYPNYYKEDKLFREKTMSMLEMVGLADFADNLATSLPYGMQRRLEIARALTTNPRILLLDEPAAGMNPQETKDLTDFVQQIREKFDLTILLIEHHMQIVMDLSDRLYVLEFGNTIAEGVPSEVQSNPKVIEAYLGVSKNAKGK